MNFIRKAVLAGALGAATLVTATPAMADHYYGRRGGDTTGAAIAGGVVGLALGAAIASGSRDRYYDDRGYYYNRRAYPRYRNYVYRDYPPRYYRPYRGDWRRNAWRERRYYGGGYYGRGW